MEFKNLSIYIPPPKEAPSETLTLTQQMIDGINSTRIKAGFKDEPLVLCLAFSSSDLAMASTKNAELIAKQTNTLPWDGELKTLQMFRVDIDGHRMSVGIRKVGA